jgi:hypothetical protein
LRHHDRFDSRVLGVLAPINRPYWLGTMPVTALSLGVLRHIEPMAAPLPLLSSTTVPSGRIRHGFVIYDGGRQ